MKIRPSNGSVNPDYVDWLTHNLKQARYLIAGGLGLTGGLVLEGHISNLHEFQADRVAVELMGEAESFKKFNDLYPPAARKVWREYNSFPVVRGFIERLEQYFENESYFFKRNIFHAHPDDEERLAQAEKHLEDVKRLGPIEVPGDAKPVARIASKTLSALGKVTEMISPLSKLRV